MLCDLLFPPPIFTHIFSTLFPIQVAKHGLVLATRQQSATPARVPNVRANTGEFRLLLPMVLTTSVAAWRRQASD